MTKELTEFTAFLADFANAIYSAKEDGKFDVNDIAKFISVALSAPTAIQGIGRIPAELRNISDEDRAEVIVLFQERLNFQANELEFIVEDLFTSALLFVTAVMKLVRKDEVVDEIQGETPRA